MSLKDVVDGVAGIGAVDPLAERRAMLEKLRQARQAFADDRNNGPGGQWITTDEAGRICFAPTRPDGQQLVIGGQSVTFWEADELPGVLDAFESAIAGGELDGQLTGSTPAGHSLPLERLAAGRPS